MADFPEHEKLKAVQPKSQVVGDFIEWLSEQGLAICERVPGMPGMPGWGNSPWVVAAKGRDTLLAAFFAIDPAALEREKRQMIYLMREANAKHATTS